MLNGLDLFSGIGGLTIALAPWLRPIAYCENDPYAQSVLLSRMRSGCLPLAGIWDDITTLRADNLDGTQIDIIFGGFPCQDISVAGCGEGLEGKHSGLVFEVFRLIDECSPKLVFLENVPAIRTRGAERVVKELAGRGYDCRWECFTAASVGAPHLRKRWFLLAAHAKRLDLRDEQRWSSWSYGPGETRPGNDGPQESLADPNSVNGREGRAESEIRGWHQVFERDSQGRSRYWAIEPDVGRVVDGLSYRVDRIRGLGNAVVPLQAREAFKRLISIVEG